MTARHDWRQAPPQEEGEAGLHAPQRQPGTPQPRLTKIKPRTGKTRKRASPAPGRCPSRTYPPVSLTRSSPPEAQRTRGAAGARAARPPRPGATQLLPPPPPGAANPQTPPTAPSRPVPPPRSCRAGSAAPTPPRHRERRRGRRPAGAALPPPSRPSRHPHGRKAAEGQRRKITAAPGSGRAPRARSRPREDRQRWGE